MRRVPAWLLLFSGALFSAAIGFFIVQHLLFAEIIFGVMALGAPR